MKMPKFESPYKQPWNSVIHVVQGAFHILTGLAMVLTLGLYRPTWVGAISLLMAQKYWKKH